MRSKYSLMYHDKTEYLVRSGSLQECVQVANEFSPETDPAELVETERRANYKNIRQFMNEERGISDYCLIRNGQDILMLMLTDY